MSSRWGQNSGRRQREAGTSGVLLAFKPSATTAPDTQRLRPPLLSAAKNKTELFPPPAAARPAVKNESYQLPPKGKDREP